MIYERFIDLVVLIMLELKNSSQIGQKEIDKLSELGYSKSEINSAFDWIYTKLAYGKKEYSTVENTVNSHRFLDEIEKRIISSEAFGYLMQLRELGIVNDFDTEILIEKSMLSGFTNIDSDEIKQIISLYLIEREDSKTNNNRIKINIKDTIN